MKKVISVLAALMLVLACCAGAAAEDWLIYDDSVISFVYPAGYSLDSAGYQDGNYVVTMVGSSNVELQLLIIVEAPVFEGVVVTEEDLNEFGGGFVDGFIQSLGGLGTVEYDGKTKCGDVDVLLYTGNLLGIYDFKTVVFFGGSSCYVVMAADSNVDDILSAVVTSMMPGDSGFVYDSPASSGIGGSYTFSGFTFDYPDGYTPSVRDGAAYLMGGGETDFYLLGVYDLDASYDIYDLELYADMFGESFNQSSGGLANVKYVKIIRIGSYDVMMFEGNIFGLLNRLYMFVKGTNQIMVTSYGEAADNAARVSIETLR